MKGSTDAIDNLVKDIAGSSAVDLFNLIKNKTNVSEFKIADKLKITVNQVRNILYKLHAKNLVTFTRKKDKKKGWYIYYWTFISDYAQDLILAMKKTRVEKLKQELEKELSGSFFSCPNKDVRFELEVAMDYSYKCPECGQVLIQEDNTEKIDHIKEEIQKLEQEIIEEESKPKVKKEFKKRKKLAKKKPERKVKKIKKKKKRRS